MKSVAASNWFVGFLGGGQPDYKNFFANFAVDAEEYLAMYPEYILTPEEKAAFLEDRRGCIVGPDTAAEVRLEGRRHLPARERHPAPTGWAGPSSS